MTTSSPPLCFRTIAADGVICADGYDVLWALGKLTKLFVACLLLLRIQSFGPPYGDATAQQVLF